MGYLKTALAIVAWLGALFSPPVMAILCWKWARQIRIGWLVHLAFVPCLLTSQWLFAGLLFWASGDTGDGPPGLGLVLIPCVGSMLLTVVVYFGVVVTVALQKRKQTI